MNDNPVAIIIYYDGYHFWNHYHFSFKKWEQVIKMSHRLKKKHLNWF